MLTYDSQVSHLSKEKSEALLKPGGILVSDFRDESPPWGQRPHACGYGGQGHVHRMHGFLQILLIARGARTLTEILGQDWVTLNAGERARRIWERRPGAVFLWVCRAPTGMTSLQVMGGVRGLPLI